MPPNDVAQLLFGERPGSELGIGRKGLGGKNKREEPATRLKRPRQRPDIVSPDLCG
ncbi:Uncharacterised protein [Mycobacteroides abscessus subsp. abscessus]|nr:Uncharacterised protein [Mycobacteroides abscessus subsp. abscessus]